MTLVTKTLAWTNYYLLTIRPVTQMQCVKHLQNDSIQTDRHSKSLKFVYR